MSKTNRSIVVKGTVVTVTTRHQLDYISLSDMVRNFEGQGALIENWLRRLGAAQQPRVQIPRIRGN
jgi:hypothetical protein